MVPNLKNLCEFVLEIINTKIDQLDFQVFKMNNVYNSLYVFVKKEYLL